MSKRAAHPLFPAKSPDEEPPEITQLTIQRAGEGSFPRAFGPDEIQSLEDVYNNWGGGHYTIIARNDRHFSGKLVVSIPGKSKPFVLGGEEAAAPPAPAAPALGPAASGAMSEQMMMMLFQMMQEQSKQTTQILVAALQARESGSRELLTILNQQNASALATQGQAFSTMLQAVTSTHQDSGNQLDAFLRGLQHGQDIIEQHSGGDDDDEDGLEGALEQIGTVIEMARRGQAAADGGGAPPPGSPAAGPPPGATSAPRPAPANAPPPAASNRGPAQ